MSEPRFYELPAEELKAGLSTADGQDILDVDVGPDIVIYHVVTPGHEEDTEARVSEPGTMVDLAEFEPPTPLPPDQHEGGVRESDDEHVFTGWCSCGWEGDDHDAGTNRRSDEKHQEAYDHAMGELNRHHDVAIREWLTYLQTPEEESRG